MQRLMTTAVAVGIVMPAMGGGTVITPLPGTLGNPFSDSNNGVNGWTWNPVLGAPSQIGNLYDNILTLNGGAATAGFFGPFGLQGTQAFLDWAGTQPRPQAQWGDDLHGLPAGAVITAIRYGYLNTVATATHTIRIYEMIPPSASHATNVGSQFGAEMLSTVLTGMPTGAAIVTVTGLSARAGSAVWIKFGESGQGFPGTFWLSGGIANGVGASHDGVVRDDKDYYGPGAPLRVFVAPEYFYSYDIVAPNIQVALSGIVPAPTTIGLLTLAGLGMMRRRRSPETGRDP